MSANQVRKMGRPLAEGSPRADTLRVRLTTREMGHVRRIAARHGVTISQWSRYVLREAILKAQIENLDRRQEEDERTA